jgi:addiction module HigA family antidote
MILPTNGMCVPVGDMLYLEFMLEMDLTATKLSNDIGIDRHTIVNIIQGDSSLVDDVIAEKFSNYFGTSVRFWTNVRDAHLAYINR